MLVIGLDGVPPEFLFQRMREVMPNVDRLLKGAVRAPLRTTDPPISVPAWPVMFTGVDPGTLGIYGFRHRKAASYTTSVVPRSRDLPVPTVWEILSSERKRVAVIGMPLGYPPPAINGVYISDFLTPAGSNDWAHPAALKDDIEKQFGPYPFDVVFRSEERKELLREIVKMTQKRFEIAEWIYDQEPWDVFAVHEIGTDRLAHAYWKYFDTSHPDYKPGNPYAHVDREYYAELDRCLGRLLSKIDDRTSVMITSDHGAMSMHGCFAINDWLEAHGYLVLKRPAPQPGTPFEKLDVDWSRTTIWGAGGYYARLFFNVRGRELQGILPLEKVAQLRKQVIAELGQIQVPGGGSMGVRVLDPREIYHMVRGEAPDLMVYLGELKWRSAGTMGHPGLFLKENDIGPDDAVHSLQGVFVLYDPAHPTCRELPEQVIRDVAPTILDIMGSRPPSHMQGNVIRGLTPVTRSVPPSEVPPPDGERLVLQPQP